MTSSDDESQYLALCEKYPNLRQKCPVQVHVQITPDHGRVGCAWCHNRYWLPLPKAERMGALVLVAGSTHLWYHPEKGWLARAKEMYFATPEAALTAALTASQEISS